MLNLNLKLQTIKTILHYRILAATPLEASSGTLNVLFCSSLCITSLCCVKVSQIFKSVSIFYCSWECCGTLPQNLPGTYGSYPVLENLLGSAVSEILWYRQTNILLLYYKDKNCALSSRTGKG